MESLITRLARESLETPEPSPETQRALACEIIEELHPVEPNKSLTTPAEKDLRNDFFVNGYFKYIPEDAEHARNPIFRAIREFEMVLKLERKGLQIKARDSEIKQDEETLEIVLYRLVQSQIIINALDNFYVGRKVASTFDINDT